ncbi:hypothetical protein [Endozoicomonas sp.]|uniref:hypothetical protein n=1 Tax=Endozoicomonas sp. TaxID=1892382 RepID=UPI002887A141|nr:hypothetical protein [Endozoicomonas sp.]
MNVQGLSGSAGFYVNDNKVLAATKELVTKEPEQFNDKLTGIAMGWPCNKRVTMLDDICRHILTNKESPNKDQVNPPSSREDIFTPTTVLQLTVTRQEAKSTLDYMLSTNDERTQILACKYIDYGLTVNTQASSSLSTTDSGSYNWGQFLMSKTQNSSKYRAANTKKNRAIPKLCDYFSDGRGGDTSKSLNIPKAMEDIFANGPKEAVNSFTRLLYGESLEDKLSQLESLFDFVAFDEKAYTRAEEGYLLSTFKFIDFIGISHSVPRKDITAPSATKISHIRLLQDCYRTIVNQLAGDPLTANAVQIIAQSRLVKCIPVQYEHDLQNKVSDLHIHVQRILENKDNVQNLNKFYDEEYTVA